MIKQPHARNIDSFLDQMKRSGDRSNNKNEDDNRVQATYKSKQDEAKVDCECDDNKYEFTGVSRKHKIRRICLSRVNGKARPEIVEH